MQTKTRTLRNMILFSIVAAGGGFLGIALDRLSPPPNPMQGLGALVWLVSPLLANLLLRAFGGDGWKDFGLGPRLKAGWIWYPAGLVITLGASLVPLGLGAIFGVTSLSGFAQQGLGAFLSLTGTAFSLSMIKNIFEEFAWRGYLTPRFEALGLSPFINALLTGVIWASWHIPYYLYFLDRTVLQAATPLSMPVVLMLAFVVLPVQAFAYSELRLLSQTVWTTWLLHTVANAASQVLILNGFISLPRNFSGVLLSPGTDGLIYTLMMGLIGFGLYTLRRRRASGAVIPS
jgi:membrane protease YdiL (CAAX protease family)